MVTDTIVTPEVEAMIGRESRPQTAVDEVCASEIRRYVLATMDDNPLWYDKAYAEKTRFGPGYAPGSYALRAVGGYHRPLGQPDPVRHIGVDGDDNGAGADVDARTPWPEGVISFHGGDEVTYFQLPKIGDVISKVSKIVSIEEKTGRSGKFAVMYSDRIFTNQNGEVLAINHGSSIARRMDTALGVPRQADQPHQEDPR